MKGDVHSKLFTLCKKENKIDFEKSRVESVNEEELKSVHFFISFVNFIQYKIISSFIHNLFTNFNTYH